MGFRWRGDLVWGDREGNALARTHVVRRQPQRKVSAGSAGARRYGFWDIASDGRLHFSDDTVSSAQLVASPTSAPERNVSVLGFASHGAIYAAERSVAFRESGHGIPDDYLVFFRRLDDSPPVELVEGSTIGPTPNGKHVVALVPSQPTKLRVLPTGAGESHTFDVAPIRLDRAFVSWMPDGKEFIFIGHAEGAPPRGYRASLDGGTVRLLTNQERAQFWNKISSDGRLVLTTVGIDSAITRLLIWGPARFARYHC